MKYLKMDIKTFERFIEKLDQLLNFYEVPDHERVEFLEECNNVLGQGKRMVRTFHMKNRYHKDQEEAKRRVIYEKRTRTGFN